MGTYNIIPLTSDPNQTMDVVIPVDGRNLKLTLGVSFNSQGNYWWLTITQNGNVVLDGLPLVYSEYPAADLLHQYSYLNLGSAFLIKNGLVADDMPNSTNLGVDFLLIWGDTIV